MDELERIIKEKLKKMLSERKNPIIEVNDEDFKEKVIEKSKKIPIVVDFWASWCTPCLMIGPVLESLVSEYNGKFILAKMNVDEGRKTSQKYGIMSIPSVKMFRNGRVVDEFIGAIPEPVIKKWLDKNISG